MHVNGYYSFRNVNNAASPCIKNRACALVLLLFPSVCVDENIEEPFQSIKYFLDLLGLRCANNEQEERCGSKDMGKEVRTLFAHVGIRRTRAIGNNSEKVRG